MQSTGGSRRVSQAGTSQTLTWRDPPAHYVRGGQDASSTYADLLRGRSAHIGGPTLSEFQEILLQVQPLIGLTAYGRNEKGDYSLPTNYVEAVRRACGLAVLIPPGETRTDAVLDSIDGLILTGGGDIDPAKSACGAHEMVYMVDVDRDRLEFDLARRVLERQMPLLAICRGLQIVNVVLGGTVHAHVPDVYGNKVTHRLPPREPVPHSVFLEPKSRTARILGVTHTEPMSWHHQAIDRLAPAASVVARAPDGVPEAIEIDDNENCLALQWHPEVTAETDPVQQKPFEWLVCKASQKKSSS